MNGAPSISSPYAAQREMLMNLADAMLPFLVDHLPASCRPTVAVTSPPHALAMVCHLGVDELPVPLEAQMFAIIEGVKKAAARTFPTLPLVFEILRPPLNRYGFVAHLGANSPEPVYPSFVSARAHLRLTPVGRKALREGAMPWRR